jgi:hypothetical protein
MSAILCQIWNIPDGFATLLLACATLIAGSFVIGAAILAWRSVQGQIHSAENIETARRHTEITAIETGFTSELLVYSRGIIQAASMWNQRAHLPHMFPREITDWPVFIDPLYYKTNIGRIGMLRQRWAGGALIGFYANLLELNEQAREALSGRPTVNVSAQNIATRSQLIASNLSQALDGLNNDRKFALQPEVQFPFLFAPDGTSLDQLTKVPENLQDLLLRLAGL